MARTRKGTESATRQRVRAAFIPGVPLTHKQVVAALGGGDALRGIAYHVHRLVAAGVLTVKRDGYKVGDGSQLRYTLKARRRGKRAR